MIVIDADIYSLANRFGIAQSKFTQYANKSIDEIIEAEAAQGNSAAAKFSREVLKDSSALVELFKLSSVGNRFAILQNLSEQELEKLLPFLEKQDLIIGLNYFDKAKLLELMGRLPAEQLVKYVLEMFPPKEIMKLMPAESMDKFLTLPDLDKNLVLKHLMQMKPEFLAQMIESVTGKPAKSLNPQELVKEIASLPQEKYKEALVNIPEDQKRKFILAMIEEKPKLLEKFPAEGFVKVLNEKEKPDLIKAAKVIEPEFLVEMLKELPQDLLAVIVTQINPEIFAQVLIKSYQDILRSIIST
ncbi:MAG TPA: hypothetical protein PLG15_00510 [Candidatus Gastranaerophilaceae bacterium]|nr:hypothetical protein [Candidatus Gastranaerophilaceae bacterium]HPT40848.1 hypothetical protein [Candidatus Gastranaerophilaceae bacterium]